MDGAGSLSKSGNGTLFLTSSSNSYLGTTSINGGTLEFVAGGLGTTGPITFGGGTLRYAAANTDDISAGGASFTLMRNIELGQVLHLSMNLPKRLRQYDLNDASYRVYALVRGLSRKG